MHDPLTESVIGGFYEVYNTFGFGFLESVYVEALCIELRLRGHEVRREVPVDVWYKGRRISRQRIDLLVDERLVGEAKATAELHGSVRRTVYNYLRASRLGTGLVLHFGLEPRAYRVTCRLADRIGGAALIEKGEDAHDAPDTPDRSATSMSVAERSDASGASRASP